MKQGTKPPRARYTDWASPEGGSRLEQRMTMTQNYRPLVSDAQGSLLRNLKPQGRRGMWGAELQEVSPYKSRTALHPTLRRMTDRGWVEVVDDIRSNDGHHKRYRITKLGRKALELADLEAEYAGKG